MKCGKTVTRWIEQGWLKATRARTKDRWYWVISREAVMDFFRVRDAWPGWEIERITDPELRDEAATVRPVDLRYLTVGEVAQRLLIEIGTVNQWIHKGRFPNAVRYGNWWIPEDDLEQVHSPYVEAIAA